MLRAFVKRVAHMLFHVMIRFLLHYSKCFSDLFNNLRFSVWLSQFQQSMILKDCITIWVTTKQKTKQTAIKCIHKTVMIHLKLENE